MVLIHLGEALMKKLNVPRGRGFGFWEVNGLADPVDFGVPLLKPGHTKDELGFSKV